LVTRFTRAAALAGITLLFSGQAAARPPTAEDLLALIELGDYRGGLSISPDGQTLAVFARETRVRENDYRHRLLVMPSTGGSSREIADAGDIILRDTPYGPTGAAADRAPVWSPDGRYLAYITERDGRAELWRASPDGAAAQLLVDGPGEVLRFAWLDDTHLVVETAAPRGAIQATATLVRSCAMALSGAGWRGRAVSCSRSSGDAARSAPVAALTTSCTRAGSIVRRGVRLA
jgi:dipeptidyl aminopeptidase/acylaminoacyl peptidase